jgi:hypothetical protein
LLPAFHSLSCLGSIRTFWRSSKAPVLESAVPDSTFELPIVPKIQKQATKPISVPLPDAVKENLQPRPTLGNVSLTKNTAQSGDAPVKLGVNKDGESQASKHVSDDLLEVAREADRLKQKLTRSWYRQKKMQQCIKANPGCVSFDDYCNSFKVYRANPTVNYPAMDPIDKIVLKAYTHYMKSSKVKLVILLAGPPGSGKTTVCQMLGKLDTEIPRKLKNGTAIYVDRTMGTGSEGIDFVQQALDHNKKVLWIHVMRHLLHAVPSMLGRAMESGRCVTPRNFATLALGSLESTQHMTNNYSEKIQIVVANNMARKEDIYFTDGLNEVQAKLKDYREQITTHPDVMDAHDAVDKNVEELNQKQYDQGGISYSVIKGTSGPDGLEKYLKRTLTTKQDAEDAIKTIA